MPSSNYFSALARAQTIVCRRLSCPRAVPTEETNKCKKKQCKKCDKIEDIELRIDEGSAKKCKKECTKDGKKKKDPP